MNPYSTLKVAWHQDRIQELRNDRITRPIELQLILSDLCNQDCGWCAYRSSSGLSSELFVQNGNRNPKRMIPEDKAREILHDANLIGVRSCIFTGGGEPTVHPQHLELFTMAMDLGIEASLNTNGVLFRKGWQDVFPRMAYVRFSIDAGTAEDYARERNTRPESYEVALRHMKELVDEQGPCVVGAGYVVTPTNYHCLREGIERIRDTGASYVRLAAMQSTAGRAAYNGTWHDARRVAQFCSNLSTPDFQVIDLMDGVMGERPDYSFCGFQQLVIYVGADLNIYRCCYTAYTKHGLGGSLKDQRLTDWFASAERRRGYAEFDARSCDVCPLNDKNRTINYLLEPAPLHVNFV